jgi:hypothetical protein
VIDIRKGQAPPRLARAEFGVRFRSSFIDPASDQVPDLLEGHAGPFRAVSRSYVAVPLLSALDPCGYILRLLPALVNAIATACLIALFLVGGWLVPIDPSFFQSSTNVLMLLLTTDWVDPFLSGMIVLLSAESIGRAFRLPGPQCTPTM